MNDCQDFPETVEEFMDEYKMVDTEEVYSNGTEYVPIFRMKQWFEHERNTAYPKKGKNMTRLIDADALKELFPDNGEGSWTYNVTVKACIDAQPTIDAVSVRHGKWIWKGEDGDSRFMCSVCRRKEYVPTCNGVPDIWQYCPSCGARMDEE